MHIFFASGLVTVVLQQHNKLDCKSLEVKNAAATAVIFSPKIMILLKIVVQRS
jgi:hypothetical protein